MLRHVKTSKYDKYGCDFFRNLWWPLRFSERWEACSGVMALFQLERLAGESFERTCDFPIPHLVLAVSLGTSLTSQNVLSQKCRWVWLSILPDCSNRCLVQLALRHPFLRRKSRQWWRRTSRCFWKLPRSTSRCLQRSSHLRETGF